MLGSHVRIFPNQFSYSSFNYNSIDKYLCISSYTLFLLKQKKINDFLIFFYLIQIEAAQRKFSRRRSPESAVAGQASVDKSKSPGSVETV